MQNTALYDIFTPLLETYLIKKAGIVCYKLRQCNPRSGLYLTHAQNHITLAVAAMDNCFSLIGSESLFNTIGKNKSLTKNFSLSFRVL